MTKFKQIIGRGTRIDDRYNKLWFTILDFKKATELFADERFDGIPEKVMVSKPEEIIDIGNPAFDEELGNTNIEADAEYTAENEGLGETDTAVSEDWGPLERDDDENRYVKYRVSGVTVRKMAERVQYYDTDGKLVTESFKDYTRNTVKKNYTSLDEFTRKWQNSERKQAIIDELAEEGVIWQALEEDVSKDMDPFDLICHVVFDQPALTRKERANNVKKRNYFTKYSAVAQTVLNTLLDKYADGGVAELESIHVLKVKPLDELGSPMEIANNAFGGKQQYQQAITDLEAELYSGKAG